jgi:hypothetical protein
MKTSTTIIPSKLIAEADVFNGEITDEMVYIAYQVTWVFDVPVYEFLKKDGKKYLECIIGKFGEMPCRYAMDFYIFAVFKTMEECVGCVEKCGYTIKPYLPSSDESVTHDDDNAREFMEALSKLKVFDIFESPFEFISKMRLRRYNPILKVRIENQTKKQFGNWRFTDPTTALKEFQQNEADVSSYLFKNCAKDTTKTDVKIALALMIVGIHVFEDVIFGVDPEIVKDIVKCYNTPKTLLKYFEERFFFSRIKMSKSFF